MDENRRIEFSLNGRDAVLICPDQPAPGMPWVWRAEFLGAFDYADRALLGPAAGTLPICTRPICTAARKRSRPCMASIAI